MKILILIILAIPAIALADKKLNSKDMSVLGKIDESNFQQQPTEKKPEVIVEKKTESKTTMTCKDKAEIVFNQGQVGYDNCLNDLKNRSDFSKKNSGVNANNNKDGSGAGINFKIGD